MGIDETRYDRSAIEVEHLGPLAAQLVQVARRADSGDPFARNGDRLDDAVMRIEGVDAAAGEEQVDAA